MVWLLVGLGNPGTEYDGTRHNIGFDVIEAAVDTYEFDGPKEKYQGKYWTGEINEQKVIALTPTTFMNRSGTSVSQVASFFKIPAENIIVFYDELDLVAGKVRVKQAGGAGGHNGIKSIDSHMNKNYWRVRIGIDHPGNPDNVSNYVLGKFTTEQRIEIDRTVTAIVEHLPLLLENRGDSFMNKVALATQE